MTALSLVQRTVARDRAVHAALLGFHHAPAIHYSQSSDRWEGIAQGKVAHKGEYPTHADCIAAGTLIELDRGQVPIEQVKPGDMVLTRAGFRRVLDAWLVRRDAEIVALPIEGGGWLRGTSDHRIWTENRGWVAMQTVTEADTLRGWQASSARAKRSPTTALVSAGTRRQKRATSGSTSTLEATAIYTESSGPTTTGQSHQATRFITPTTTPTTTTQRTSFAFLAPSIVESQQSHGPSIPTSAITAGSTSRPRQGFRASGGSVAVDARRHSLAQRVAISPSVHAPSVARRSPQTSIGPAPTARIGAMRPLGRAVPAGRSDVYDLTVEGRPEFFADGVLVHNCSAFATWCLWNGLHQTLGLPDVVNGEHWGAGYTGTMAQHGRQVVHLNRVLPGDCVLYGPAPTYEHVAIVVGVKGGVPMVVSHGSEPGPFLLPYNYRPDVGQFRRYILKEV